MLDSVKNTVYTRCLAGFQEALDTHRDCLQPGFHLFGIFPHVHRQVIFSNQVLGL